MAENILKSVVEALLFAGERPLSADQIRRAIDGVDNAEARSLIEELMKEYEGQQRGMRIIEVAGGYRMITAPEFGSYMKRMYKDRLTEKLSKPALETLAIIAYKQPLTKMEIEDLRNVNVDGVIKNLLDKSLIRVCGRKKIPGRPLVFGTTKQFLEYFGLKSLEDLPKIEELSILNEKMADAGTEIEPIEEAPLEEPHEPTRPQEAH